MDQFVHRVHRVLRSLFHDTHVLDFLVTKEIFAVKTITDKWIPQNISKVHKKDKYLLSYGRDSYY